jgi:hypothetical protein
VSQEIWILIEPSGRAADWKCTSRKSVEDYMIAEALTGSAPDEETALERAYEVGYKIKRIS